ncbi:hypothetical protein H0A36_25320 [Endozoicomonas sp. SM1973]|uniref:Uncharacterized protein n=1 Tax=Spartinivicinus marinus TaxID=2994442 RepID=A0A853I7Q2_9GAMM|nr:hypothetical protein [Spartinivicinus marinus]NYZ69343.1 hypothetical protein [Spartinivicinus marinus]
MELENTISVERINRNKQLWLDRVGSRLVMIVDQNRKFVNKYNTGVTWCIDGAGHFTLDTALKICETKIKEKLFCFFVGKELEEFITADNPFEYWSKN